MWDRRSLAGRLHRRGLPIKYRFCLSLQGGRFIPSGIRMTPIRGFPLPGSKGRGHLITRIDALTDESEMVITFALCDRLNFSKIYLDESCAGCGNHPPLPRRIIFGKFPRRMTLKSASRQIAPEPNARTPLLTNGSRLKLRTISKRNETTMETLNYLACALAGLGRRRMESMKRRISLAWLILALLTGLLSLGINGPRDQRATCAGRSGPDAAQGARALRFATRGIGDGAL